MFYLIETSDTDLDDRSDELVGRMTDDGVIQLTSEHLNIEVTVVGKASPLYNTDREYVVEPLEGQ